VQRILVKGTMALLCLLVAAYAAVLVFATSLRPPLMQMRFATYPIASYLHFGAGALVIALAPLQLSARLRRRRPAVHRWSGRAYAIGVLLSGAGGLSLSRISQGGTPAHLGFGLLALAWLGVTIEGVRRVLVGDVAGHERWMVRSVALTFAAVTLRIYIPAGAIAGLPFDAAYQAIAWLCWVPNLFVAEWLVRRKAVAAKSALGRTPAFASLRG